jgi:HAD superfamily hydrolase (TIGR01509 family)
VRRALVFDFDGLILDTEGPEFQAWQEIYTAHGCHLALETWAACIGTRDAFDPYADLAARAGRALDTAAIRTACEARVGELIAREAVRPGVRDYLDEARELGLGLAVASSSSRRWVVGHLERLGLADRFDALRCADDVPRVKPDPDLYFAALDALGAPPAAAIALEDSPNGVLAAKRAGLFCVAVPNPVTARLDLNAADMRVASLDELPLPALLRRAGR